MFCRRRAFSLCVAALLACCGAVEAAEDAVSVTALRNPVDKSYRRMMAGMERFERRHALAPGASLRFKLLPRNRETRMENVELAIVGDSFETPVELAADRTFTLPRDPKALKESASVRPNRKAGTMTWRAEVRTPGLPAGTRRLGDLRLECEVGMEAELISNTRPLLGLFGALLSEGAQYCNRSHPLYLFFAERPVFAVALVDGARREVLSVDNLYMGASRNPDWKRDLRYCDCEVLLDRAYTLPLGDRSWPDDALVEFETMEGGSTGESAGADVPAAFEEAVTIPFDSGYQVRVYRERTPPEKRQDKEAPPPPELVQLVAPSGIVTKSRVR